MKISVSNIGLINRADIESDGINGHWQGYLEKYEKKCRLIND